MIAFDFVILFIIAGWAVSFHGAMIGTSKEVSQGRFVITIVFTLLGTIAIAVKALFL